MCASANDSDSGLRGVFFAHSRFALVVFLSRRVVMPPMGLLSTSALRLKRHVRFGERGCEPIARWDGSNSVLCRWQILGLASARKQKYFQWRHQEHRASFLGAGLRSIKATVKKVRPRLSLCSIVREARDVLQDRIASGKNRFSRVKCSVTGNIGSSKLVGESQLARRIGGVGLLS